MKRAVIVVVAIVAFLVVGLLGFVELRHRSGERHVAEEIAAYRPPRLHDFGSTKTLTILPLVDWHVANEDLEREVGLSYLIETDEHRILFDVGHNAEGTSPSPLEHNMKALGVNLADIDTVFISHNHLDHVGGMHRQNAATFGLGNEQAPLPHPDARAFVPIDMTYPDLEPIRSDEPMLIGNGVATTGTVPRQLAIGRVDEQSLAVHVEGLGVVLVVGCGHQPIPNLLKRYDDVFDEPLHGIFGGLHLPVPKGRLSMAGMDVQRRFASGGGVFSPLTMEEVNVQLDLLRERGLGAIGVGGHDSSDEVIALFADAFGDAYHFIRVGEPIVIGAPQ